MGRLDQKALDAGTTCPDAPLTVVEFKTAIDAYSDSISVALAGGSLSPASDLLQTGQTTSYGPGSDGDLEKGTVQSFTDNGDGTITDSATGLMWEKKEDLNGPLENCTSAEVCPNPHDADNLYTWTASGESLDGSVVSVFLAELNDVAGGGVSCFAGHCDWRLADP